MVFTPLHGVPSALAAILIVVLALTKDHHRSLANASVILSIIGLIGYLFQGNFHIFALDFHAFHSWAGVAALSTFLYSFIQARNSKRPHCRLGQMAAALAAISLLTGGLLLTGLVSTMPITTSSAAHTSEQEPASSRLPEIEASEYQ